MNKQFEKDLDEILLKPYEWQYDDYQKAKAAILALFERRAVEAKKPTTATEIAVIEQAKRDYERHLNCMTGKDWYDSYKRELGFGSFDDVKDMARGEYLKGIEIAEMKCDEAAKRASGLEKGL